MRGAATVESRCGWTFEHGHGFDVVGVDGRDAVAEVIAAFACTAKVGVVQRHTIHYIQRLVVAGHLGVTTEQHTCRTRCAASGVLYHETCHLTRERVDDIRLLCLGEVFALHLFEAIS